MKEEKKNTTRKKKTLTTERSKKDARRLAEKVSKMVYPSEHQNNRETYLRIVEKRGLKPRFSSFLDNPNYMKLVNETRQSESQTKPLKPDFALDAAKESFGKLVEKGGYYEGWYNDGIDVDGEAEIVAQDIREGKKANEVDYGRQDRNGNATPTPEELMASRKKSRSHGASADKSVRKSKEIVAKINDTVDAVLQQGGKLGTPYNQVSISAFPSDISMMVSKATAGKIDLENKRIAINGDDLWHEYIRHSDEEVEAGRRQLPLTADTIKEAVLAIYDPDLVESIFTTTDNQKQRQSFAYAKKSSEGYHIVVEVVGGRRNPNVTPAMILRFNEEKWNEMISSGLTLGEILYENDEEFKSRLDVELNKNNRVTAAQFASIEAIAYTPRSPRFNFSIPQDSDLSTGSAKKVSESARKSTAHEAKLADELERWFESLTIKGK